MNGNKFCQYCDAYKVGSSVMHQPDCVTWDLPPEWNSEEFYHTCRKCKGNWTDNVPAGLGDECSACRNEMRVAA